MVELLLKASFAIGIAFLFYKLLLQQESFFAINRLYLVGCIVVAFILPFVPLPSLVSQQGYLSSIFQQKAVAEAVNGAEDGFVDKAKPIQIVQGEQQEIVVQQERKSTEEVAVRIQPQVGKNQAASSGYSTMFWISMFYLFGVAVFTLSLLFQIGGIVYKIITTPDKIQDGDCVIVNVNNKQAPCSFFRYVFIYPDDYDFETYEQIVAHEKIHARLGHSLDLLIAEVAVILLWFNPFIWLLRREIEKNNEFQTDATLLEKLPVRKDQYQLNLLQIVVPNKPLSITTNYNQTLLKQRIMMMNAKKSTLHAYWKYAFLAPLLFGMLLLINEPAVSQSKKKLEYNRTSDAGQPTEQAEPAAEVQREPLPAREPMPQPHEVVSPVLEPMIAEKTLATPKVGESISIRGGQVDISQGYWYSHQEDGKYCLQLKGGNEKSNWNISRCFDKASFEKKGVDNYVMTKETGTLQLTGNLEAEVGQGKYVFTENASFSKYLAENNISSRDKNFQFHLFFSDINKSYIGFLKKQYDDIDGDRILELAIHGISQENFKNFLALFQKYSSNKPSVQDVVAARIHGIDETYVQELHQAGLKDASLQKMMEAKIHGLTSETIKEMKSLGLGELSLNKMIELKIHGVNATYIKDLREAGFDNLSTNQYLEAKIHGLDATSIKEIRALGFKDLEFNDIMTARIHGVDATYVKDIKKAGFDNLSMRKVVEAKIHGVDSEFINMARKEGYNLNSIDKYITLKIHGMAIESLKE